jgi:cobalt-zinc-cadmium resistance protein CzcA
MQAKLARYPGIDFNFSQPIMDNVEEWVAGVKGSLALKIYGYDPETLEKYADKAYNQMKTIKGIEDLSVIRLIGQPEQRIILDEAKMALYGVNKTDAQSVIQMAIGGSTATSLYEGEKQFDVRVRYAPEFRQTDEAIGNLAIPTSTGTKIPLKLIANITTKTGMEFLYRDDNKRYIAVKFSVRGRDLGSTIAEAQEKVNKAVKLEKGMRMEWKGEYENQVRATKRLEIVVPISLVAIFFILYFAFGNFRDAGLIFLNVPFSLMGGILALYITGTNFSISAGIGFIALFGVAVQSGVILISIFHQFLQEKKPLSEAIFEGTMLRVRPVFMTALMAMLGLMPAALSTGIGSETQKPLAIVVIGGLITDTILSLHIFPLIVEMVYKRVRSHGR